jgi:hypothetical protein
VVGRLWSDPSATARLFLTVKKSRLPRDCRSPISRIAIAYYSRFQKIPREELMRRVVIDVTGMTHAPG